MIDHAAIFRIACALRPYYDRVEALFDKLRNDPDCDVVKTNAEWIKSCEVYSALLLEHAPAIAFSTRNSAENIRMLFRVSSDVTFIVWTPKDLLQVARYESFNSKYWSSPNAVVKNEYEFPQ
jgi:hypothetical protein